jgi:hypothetical protein
MNDTLRALLTRLIDYAGLFPPATLGMPEAVANYARYRDGDHRWMLARFIVPVSRLDELESAAAAHLTNADEWILSVLPGVDVTADLDRIEAFNRRNENRARIDTMEAKADHPEAIRALSAKVPDEIALFIEIPGDDDPEPLITEIAAAGRFAKIRTGGVTADAFLPPEKIIRFIRRCHDREVAFKATAGLHHPLRCVRPFTDEPDSPRGAMNGFVNLFLAAALLRAGLPDDELVDLLLTDDASAVSIEGDVIRWRRGTVDLAALAGTRRELAISFGSCSFEDPVQDLRELAWLA